MIIITAKDWVNRARMTPTESTFNEWCEILTEILKAIYKLPDRRERVVLIDYFCNRLTVKEIAGNLGLTVEHTFRIKRAAIDHLGEALGFG